MSWQSELASVARKHRGVLRAADVVEFARNPKTELHSKFTWDDTEAAQQYRVWQARRLIRVSVDILPGVDKKYHAWVSLETDRDVPKGGYRATAAVLSNPARRIQLLEQALREFKRWERRYIELTELVPIFEAADGIKKGAPV